MKGVPAVQEIRYERYENRGTSDNIEIEDVKNGGTDMEKYSIERTPDDKHHNIANHHAYVKGSGIERPRTMEQKVIDGSEADGQDRLNRARSAHPQVT
jgi:hypothetical protein